MEARGLDLLGRRHVHVLVRSVPAMDDDEGPGLARVHVYHITAPTCWWSWGFEGVLNRLPLVYGDQVAVHTYLGCVYEDLGEYREHYDLDDEAMAAWRDEAVGLMGLPLAELEPFDAWPRTVFPATLAVAAARDQGEPAAARLQREVLRRFCVEGDLGVCASAALEEAAAASGLDVHAWRSAFKDEDGLRERLEHQGHGWPHVPLGFYNLAITDNEGTTVLLDHAFEPAQVEAAVEYVAGAPLERSEPGDPVAYLARHGPAPTVELARVFGLQEAVVGKRLGALGEQGRVRAMSLAGATHWAATGR